MIELEDKTLNIDDLYVESVLPNLDNPEEELDTPTLLINLEEVNELAKNEATEITERLSNYYFDERYLKEHPYITNKIKQEINNIRRLLKMLSINEAAQDALIQNITSNAGKGSLYQSLTSLQQTTLNIQTHLNKTTADIENIFREMQENCDRTFTEKDLEEDDNSGKMVVRGSREFINSLITKGYLNNKIEIQEKETPKQLDLFGNET